MTIPTQRPTGIPTLLAELDQRFTNHKIEQTFIFVYDKIQSSLNCSELSETIK